MIVLQTRALKAINKGGFDRTTTTRRGRSIYQHTVKAVSKGYVVFNCPGCGRRNKRPVAAAERSNKEMIAFRCHGCRNTVEIFGPMDEGPRVTLV